MSRKRANQLKDLHRNRRCDKCSGGGKPCLEYDVFDRWLPDSGTEVLFVAESPPFRESKYFYDVSYESKMGGLRQCVLSNLDLYNRYSCDEDRLREFRRIGFFLVDVVKCRPKAKSGQGLRTKAVSCGEEFLEEEIRIVDPKTLVILGRSALLGAKQTSFAASLERITSVCQGEWRIEKDGVEILISPLCVDRNVKGRRCGPRIGRVFETLKEKHLA